MNKWVLIGGGLIGVYILYRIFYGSSSGSASTVIQGSSIPAVATSYTSPGSISNFPTTNQNANIAVSQAAAPVAPVTQPVHYDSTTVHADPAIAQAGISNMQAPIVANTPVVTNQNDASQYGSQAWLAAEQNYTFGWLAAPTPSGWAFNPSFPNQTAPEAGQGVIH